MRTFIQRSIKHFSHHIFSILILSVFSMIMLQPHKFEVDQKHGSQDIVLASYENLLNSTAEEDGAIAFESLIVGEDGDTKITYVVQVGDTLSKIAKNFGTTVSTIVDTNLLYDNTIRPGDRLTITYNEGIIYEVNEPTTLADLSTKYNLKVDDLLTLNYMDDPYATMEVGTQLFVDLNKIEALEKGLIEKKEYEMLAIAAPEPEPDTSAIDEATLTAEEIADLAKQYEEQNIIDTGDKRREAPEDTEAQDIDEQDQQEDDTVQQKVISAEETEKHLKSLEEAQEPETVEEPEQESLCPDTQCELAGRCYTRPDNASCVTDSADTAWECNEGYEEKGRSCVKIEPTCPEGQCELNGKCYSKPANAVCAVESDDDAWKCAEGYEERGKSCVAIPQVDPTPVVEAEPAPQPEAAPAESEPEIVAAAPTPSNAGEKNEEVVSQWYFNPRKAGFPGYGWGAGHCTEYAAYYWWKHYNVNLREYIRGNAGQWYTNASNAGLSVGQTPAKGAIVVMKYGSSGWSSYGHVGIVTQVDMVNRMIRIQDANFLGRFVVTDHWVDMDSEENPIIGYIYPGS